LRLPEFELSRLQSLEMSIQLQKRQYKKFSYAYYIYFMKVYKKRALY
jgi:hypothetical protein